MKQPDGCASVKMNANGPHFYASDSSIVLDGLTNVMNVMLTELDAESSVPVEHKHIVQNVEITTVEWKEEDGEIEFEVEPFIISDRWYKQDPIHSFQD